MIVYLINNNNIVIFYLNWESGIRINLKRNGILNI